MLSFGRRVDDRRERAGEARCNPRRPAQLPASATVVLDAELDTREEVGALVGRGYAREQRVIDALRGLPHRQRDCVVLRYYDELGIDDIASTLGISRNSVKTHLGRALDALERDLAAEFDPERDAATEVIS